MTDQTPAYWIVIYTADDWTDADSGDRRPLISAPMWAKTPEEAAHRIETARQGRTAQNTVGPFTDQVEAESYRRTWAREQGKTPAPAPSPAPTGRVARQLTIADLLDETASVIHTNEMRERPGRTPAQNAALPPAVSLYGAMNIVICGDPDDTRGSRNGVNSADLVRTFASFLDDGSPLQWSREPERTHAEIMNALRGCASVLRDAVNRSGTVTTPAYVGDTFVGPRVLVHVGDTLRHRDMPGTFRIVGRDTKNGRFLVARDRASEPFRWDAYEMPGNAGSPFTLVECPHLDTVAESGTDDPADSDVFNLLERSGVEDPADTEVIETGPGFPVACASVHEHDPIACAPDLGVSAYPVTSWVVTVHADDDEGDPETRAGSVLTTPDLDTFLNLLRDAGLTVSVDRAGGEITYASAICPTGYIRFRRPNPGEIGDAHTAAPVPAPKSASEPNTNRYRLAVLPKTSETVYGVRDVARNIVLSDAFGEGYGEWSGTREAAESVVSAKNAEWMAAGGWNADIYVNPDAWVTVDAHNGPERWTGREWNKYVTGAEESGTEVIVRILSID